MKARIWTRSKKDVIIKTDHGLHARPAAQFIKKASFFALDIIITFKDKEINGKNILVELIKSLEN